MEKAGKLLPVSREELEEEVELQVSFSDGILKIRIRNRDHFRWSGWKNSYNVSCEVVLPSRISCELKSSDGDLPIRDTAADQKLPTSYGDIRFEDLSGGLVAETSDGDVSGSFLNLKRKISIATSDRSIDVVVPSGAPMDLTMKGDDLYLPRIDLNGKISENHIEGSVNGGGIPVRLVTSDGKVEVSFC